jgi:hypothetical protein
MNLGNRCCRECGFVEGREQHFERAGELDLDPRPRLTSRKGRQAVLQARQIESDLLAEQIGSRRQELAELDKARTQLAERRGEALARAQRAGRTASKGMTDA